MDDPWIGHQRMPCDNLVKESPSSRRDDIFTQVMGEGRGDWVCTFGLGFTPSDIYGPQVPAVEPREMENAERARRIAAKQMMVSMKGSMKERMGWMEAHMNQIMIYFQMFTQHGQPSSSFEPVFNAPPDIQRDV